jgi:DNA mismatch repair protein MSH2
MRFTSRTSLPYTPITGTKLYPSQQVYRTNTVLKPLGRKASPLQSVTLSQTLAKEFLREALTAKQLRIEIWIPEGGAKKSATRFVLSKQASPGNLQDVEDLIFGGGSGDGDPDGTAPPIVLAIRVSTVGGLRSVGTASADASVRAIGIAQFAETDLFSNLEVCDRLLFPSPISLIDECCIESHRAAWRERMPHSSRGKNS